MISRRSVRIKAMQAVYAIERSEGSPALHFENHLKKNILSVQDQYIFHLLLIREVANFAGKMAVIKANKFLKSEGDKNYSTKILSNLFVQYLNTDTDFLDKLKKSKLEHLLKEDIVRKLHTEFTQLPLYVEYIESEKEFDFEQDKKIIKALYEEIILENELVNNLFDEIWPTWEDDIEFVHSLTIDAVKKSKEDLKTHLNKSSALEKFKEIMDFGMELYFQTLNNKKEHMALIMPKLKNWEMDRIAILDQIILRMALTEFTDFKSIPLKVTINEYLDISKEYSTPKSKDFINGILDKIMKELKETGKIQKIGRGLINN